MACVCFVVLVCGFVFRMWLCGLFVMYCVMLYGLLLLRVSVCVVLFVCFVCFVCGLLCVVVW